MGAPPKADRREERRNRAWALKQHGWLQRDIAAALGVSAGAMSQWLTRARELSGVEALARRPPQGRMAPVNPGAASAGVILQAILPEIESVSEKA